MTSAATPWVDGLTFTEALARTVGQFGDHDALVFPQAGYRRTYREFHADVTEAEQLQVIHHLRAFLDSVPGEAIPDELARAQEL